MRRVLRHLFTILSAMSLMLCVGTCVLWVRSYWLEDIVGSQRVEGVGVVRSAEGHFVVEVRFNDCLVALLPAQSGIKYARGEAWPAETYLNRQAGEVQWKWGGFAWYEERSSGQRLARARGVMPCWSIALATAVLPFAWITKRWSARRRMRVGMCPSCGYDLRESPERCPECGTARAS